MNDPPVAKLFVPPEGAGQVDGESTLHWKGIDSDTPLESLTYDLFFGSKSTPPLYESGITENSFTVGNLEEDEIYYWYVTPHDGESGGPCVSGVWSFDTITPLTPPDAELIGPADNATVEKDEGVLQWRPVGSSKGEIEYRVLMGREDERLGKVAETAGTEYRPLDLERGTSYRWTVIPVMDGKEGGSLNGVWRFEVEGVPDIDLDLRSDIEVLDLSPGEKAVFNIAIINNGGDTAEVNMFVVGPLAEHLTTDVSLLAAPGETEAPVRVEIPDNTEPGIYRHIIRVYSETDGENVSVALNVEEVAPEGGGGNGEEEVRLSTDSGRIGGPWLWVLALIAIFLSLVLILLLLFGKKEEKEEPEVVEVEPVRYASDGFIDYPVRTPG